MSGVEDLIAFLNDRLDEEEVDAQKAMDALAPIGPVSRELPAEPIEWVLNRLPVAVRQHIVRHDPARVLAEVEAKRRLLEQFRLRGNSVRATVQPATGGVWDDLLRLLALPYADHRDYREEWKP